MCNSTYIIENKQGEPGLGTSTTICTTNKGPVFEFSTSPPRVFLRWLLENPDRLTEPPEKVRRRWSKDTQTKRTALLAGEPGAQTEAVNLLDESPRLPSRASWRLEGRNGGLCGVYGTRSHLH